MHADDWRVGGVGHTLLQQAWFCGSGGSGHLPRQPGQFAGAPVDGQNVRHSRFFGSKSVSSQTKSGSGTAASFGGSGMPVIADQSIVSDVWWKSSFSVY